MIICTQKIYVMTSQQSFNPIGLISSRPENTCEAFNLFNKSIIKKSNVAQIRHTSVQVAQSCTKEQNVGWLSWITFHFLKTCTLCTCWVCVKVLFLHIYRMNRVVFFLPFASVVLTECCRCPLQVPVAHCFGPAGHKKRFCCVCRKQTEGNAALRCEGQTSFTSSQTSSDNIWYEAHYL